MITVFPCRLDVDELCDQCVNSIDCSRTCSDFTCTCDFNYNGTLCDQRMHKTSITNTLGCLQAFTQATSSAGKLISEILCSAKLNVESSSWSDLGWGEVS